LESGDLAEKLMTFCFLIVKEYFLEFIAGFGILNSENPENSEKIFGKLNYLFLVLPKLSRFV